MFSLSEFGPEVFFYYFCGDVLCSSRRLALQHGSCQSGHPHPHDVARATLGTPGLHGLQHEPERKRLQLTLHAAFAGRHRFLYRSIILGFGRKDLLSLACILFQGPYSDSGMGYDVHQVSLRVP